MHECNIPQGTSASLLVQRAKGLSGLHAPASFEGPKAMRILLLTLMAGLSAACSNADTKADLKGCRFDLAKLPQKQQMANDQRFAFLNTCMEAKGWHASEKCRRLTLEGTEFCDYER